MTDAERTPYSGCYWNCVGHYLVCRCGAWNTRDAWHLLTYKDRCYMCGLPLFRDFENTDGGGI